MNATTLDQALETVMRLPVEQQEMLLEIMHRRHIEARRKEIAQDAQASLAAFRTGDLNVQSAENIIVELHEILDDEE